MKTKAVLLSVMCAIVIAGITFGVCHCWIIYRRSIEEAPVVCDLQQLLIKLNGYYDAQKKWPEKLDDLKLKPYEIKLTDLISGKPFIYFPDATRNTKDVLLAQPEPFRMGLWPLGKMKRHAVLAIGEHVEFNGQEAITLRKK